MTINDSERLAAASTVSPKGHPQADLDHDLDQLLELGNLIQSSIERYVEGKRKLARSPVGDVPPPRVVFDAQRNLLAAAGKLTELVVEPGTRLQETAIQYMESRALHIVADKRVADILAVHGKESGVHIDTLAQETRMDSRKLVRILRVLCSNGIFCEISPDVFANNRVSVALVQNEPLRAYMLHLGCTMMAAAMQLPRVLNDPVLGSSYEDTTAPFQTAMGTTKSYWEWMEETPNVKDLKEGRVGDYYTGVWGSQLESTVKGRADDESVPRPELGLFGLAMQGSGRVGGRAHFHGIVANAPRYICVLSDMELPCKDFPWDTLGEATVVDVGGGIGSFCLELSKLYPRLHFVVQDRAPVLASAEHVWRKENLEAISTGRVQFQPANFFEENQVKGAEVYWLRMILHDWSDEYCLRILSAIRAAMSPTSRILIGDHLMITPVAQSGLEVPQAPNPLPANWGNFRKYSYGLDMGMMCCFNGQERTPAELNALVQKAGLKIRAIHDIRSYLGLIEIVLPEA